MPQRRTVFIVDDDQEAAGIARLRLEGAGYRVVTAANGQDGLAQLVRVLPDLILTDAMMRDGTDFYKQLKNNPAWSRIPVLVMASRTERDKGARVVGRDGFVDKPFDHQDLLAKVARFFQSPPGGIARSRDAKALVAGSDDGVMAQMAVMLKQHGCEVEIVSTGPDVISRAVVFSPGLLVLETRLYGMSSPEVVQIIRQMPQLAKTVVLVYSYYKIDDLGCEDVRQRALGVDADQAACVENGADAYIGRFNENAFLKTVAKYFPVQHEEPR